LLKIDDVDAVTFAVNVLLHLRVPLVSLVTEVGTGREKILNL